MRKLTPPPQDRDDIAVAILTGGSDRPYVFGLTMGLVSEGAALDLVGSDELDLPEFRGKPPINFLNLRGSQNANSNLLAKVFRILIYYARLSCYAATAKPKIFHILWNNKFEFFDRTLLTLYYKLLGKKLVLTVHNVNAGKRDSGDSALNRFTLRLQYQLADHTFVHTEKMKLELIEEFGVPQERVTVIPFGINNSVPNTKCTTADAKRHLGIRDTDRTILFFGRITPYKGLEYLISAHREISARQENYRLLIAGRPDRCEKYWNSIVEMAEDGVKMGQILLNAKFIPDDQTELYFKAADVLVLPYKDIYQSGVLFLAHSFGLPVLVADVGSLKDDIVEGENGFVFKPEHSADLARTIERYFASDLYAELSQRRNGIQALAAKRHSWDIVSRATIDVYAGLL